MPDARVAVIDDCEFFLKLISYRLLMRKLDVRCYIDIQDFLSKTELSDWRPDIFLIDYDFGYDRPTGIEIMAFLQEKYSVPMIMLTGYAVDNDNNLRLQSYYAGAVNFLTKPYDINELHAIIENLTATIKTRVRESESSLVSPNILRLHDNCRYELFSRTIVCSGKNNIKLTEKESSLLEILLKNKNSMVERDQVYRHIYGHEMHPLNRSIDNLACRLRSKIGEVCKGVVIENHRSLGYRLYTH